MEITRGGGKTTACLKLAFIAMQALPGSFVLFMAPGDDDAETIINDKWESEFPHHLIDKSARSKGIIRFKNGSWMKITHSGKSQKKAMGRGWQPTLVIYDEFAWHNPRTHNSMEPGFRKGTKLLIASTPPDEEEIAQGKAKHYVDMCRLCNNPEIDWTAFYRFDADAVKDSGIWDEGFLDRAEQSARVRGEYASFLQEYYLQKVYRSKVTFFNTITESDLIPRSSMARLVETVKDPSWVVVGDTSGSTRWGTLFFCFDEAKGRAYIIDSIVREREGHNSSDNRKLSELTPHTYWPIIQRKLQKWTPGRNESAWEFLWDHDTVFMDVIPQAFGDHINIVPADKKHDKKKEVYTLVTDLIRMGRILISEDAKDILHEMRLVSIDPKNGNIRKGEFPDELLDCLKYFIMWYDACFEKQIELEPVSTVPYWEQKLNNHYESQFDGEGQLNSFEEILKPGEWW